MRRMRAIGNRTCTSTYGLWLACVLCAGGLGLAGCKAGDVDFDWDGSFDEEDAGRKDAGGAGSGARPDTGVEPDDDAGEPLVDASAPADASMPGDGPEDWPARLAQATCAALEDCYGSAGLLADALSGRDCLTLNTNELQESELNLLPDSVASGAVIYRPEGLDRCLADVRALGCEVRSRRLPASCTMVIAGTVALGEECVIDAECEGDAFCDKGSEASCPSRCTARGGEGAECRDSDDDQCKDGLVCPSQRDSSQPPITECAKLGEAGNDCGGSAGACMPGLLCVNLLGTGMKCWPVDDVQILDEGDTCTPGEEQCRQGLVCESRTQTSGQCAPKVGAGESCRPAQPSQCPVTQYCSAQGAGQMGTCVDLPKNGEACVTSRSQPCAEGLVCLDEGGEDVCRPRKRIGQDCSVHAECYTGYCGPLSTCTTPPTCE